MKKQGFTLAEVLITLTIIGVVAVLTLPALMTNTNEQQAKTALAKMTNTLTNAAHMAQTNLGFDFSDVKSDNTSSMSESMQSIYSILANTAAIDMAVKSTTVSGFASPAVDTEILFKDGTSLLYGKDAKASDNNAKEVLADGAINGIYVIFDTNGTKGPNVVSNCVSDATGITSWSADDSGATTASAGGGCATKSHRVIKDRFMMKLRGGYVTPLGAASTWALTGATQVPEINTSGVEEEEEEDNVTE